MKKNIILFTCGILLVSALFSCNKMLDLKPISHVNGVDYWKTPEQVDAFVTGVHARLRTHTLNLQYLGEMRADVFGTDPGSNGSFTGEATQGAERMWNNNLTLDNAGVSNFGGFYDNINQLNLLISKINSGLSIPTASKNYYLGVGHGLRAFYYFHILRSWGKAIIQTEPINEIDIAHLAKAASSEDSVMRLIKEDIDKSVGAFANDYSFKNQKGIWSKAATLMLKAEVYLWTSYRGGGASDAGTAKSALTDIQTNIPALGLEASYANVFSVANKVTNKETIFAIKNKLNESQLPFLGIFLPQTGLIANFYDSVGNRKFDVNTDNWGGLLRAPVKIATFRRYNDNDLRKWVNIQPAYNKPAAVYVIAGAFANKYQGEQNAGKRELTNDYPIYRYADLLLLLAEAKVILGESPATEINAVRARAYGSNYSAGIYGYPNQTIDSDPKTAILQERFYEFMFEGKRWYDLRRMGNNYVFANTNIPSSDAYKLLWPIDRNTLTNNRALAQNPGYAQF